MSKLVAFRTYERFRSAFENNNINEYALNFIVDTGQLYTHGFYLNSVSFGAESNGGIPLTVAGISKTLSLSSHTHSNYLEKNTNIDIGNYKIVSGNNNLLSYNNGLQLGDTEVPTYIKGAAYRDSYTILDTGNFSITNLTTNGTILSNVALFTYNNTKFLLDYVKRLNTSTVFNSLASYTCLGTTFVDQKYYGFITFYAQEGTLNSPWALLRINITNKLLEYRTSTSTTWASASDIPLNALNTAGIVAAPTSSTVNKVWKTDANGNPGWRDEKSNTFYNLRFLQVLGTDLMTYNSQEARTIVAGDNITFSCDNNILTIRSKGFTDNVTTSAIIGSSATATTLITNTQTNPYYNLLEGGAVTRSIRFVAGTGITVASDTNGNITIGCQYAPKVSNTTSGLPATAADGQYLKWFSIISSTISGSAGYAGDDTGFPVSNNANGILWLGTHSGPYGHQIGVSSNGELYDRYISNNTFPTTANGGSWKLILNNSNSSVSGGGSTWGSSITVKIGNVSKTLTIPSNPNTNTWRNIYTSGTSRIGTGIDTKAMNFASSNLNITYLAAGTSSGQSGSTDYFTIRIDAIANAVGVAGYVAAPTKAANPNQVWMTNAEGVPAWRNATASAVLANAANSTTQLTAGQANPFYNLLFGGSVVRSVQFAAGEGVTVGTTDGSDVKITNVAPVYYIKGNADITAGTWTGTDSRISAYYEGLTIIFVPQIAGASTTTLNINGLGAKTCYFTNTSKLTTHYAVGTPIMLTYYADTWKRADYNSDNNYYSMNVNPRYKVYLDSDSSKSGAIRRYTLIAKCPGKTLTSLTLTENSTASTKTMYSGPLLLDQIYYWNSTVNYSAGANMTTNSVLYDNWSLLDIRYTFNCIGLLTAYQPFYIVLNRRADGYYQLASTPWLCGEPTEDSETKIYVQLGIVYPDTTPYRISLETVKKYYIRRGGVMINYYPSSGIVSNNAATIGTSLTTIATVNGVDITAKIGSYAASDHIHSIKINNSTKTITAPGEAAVNLGRYVVWNDSTGSTARKIYDVNCGEIFTGKEFTDGPVASGNWISGIALASNWDDNHHQHYLVESNNRWYTTRTYTDGAMNKWYTFAYLSDIVANAVGVAGYVAAPTAANNKHNVWMTDSDGKPAWRAVVIPASVPTIGTSNTTIATIGGITIQAKIGSYAASDHTHYYLVTSGDYRNVVTAPDNYANKFTFVGLKSNSTLGISGAGTYSYLIGLRGWNDHSGGGSHELAFSQGLGLFRRIATDASTWGSWIRIADSSNISNKATTIGTSLTTIATIAGVDITTKISSNTKDAAGIVPAGVASSVYMTDASKNPSWTSIDTTVTSGSSHLVTSGAVYTAIANNVASAVQYQGTIASQAEMTALTSAGQGDFARVTTAFTFTDASGASVTAHVGDVVYLTNNTPGTASNWIVAHTEIDTNTWTAASTSVAGYVPKLVTGGTNLAAASTDYILAYINGATTPQWLKLPANAYLNTWTALSTSAAGYVPAASSGNSIDSASSNTYYFLGYTGSTIKWYKLPANAFNNNTYTGYDIVFLNNAGTTVDIFRALASPSKTLKAGTNIQMTAASNVITITATDTWNANAVGVAGYVAAPTKADNANMVWKTDSDGNPAWRMDNNTQYYLTLNGTVNGTASSTNLGTIWAPTAKGTGFLKCNNGTWSYDNTIYATPDTTTTLSRAAGNLTKDTWSDVGTFANTVAEGTWVMSFTIDGSLYSGVFSRKKSDTMNEEIDLHAAGTSARRIYARTTGNKIQIATSDATFNPGAVTFNFRKLI